VGTPPADVRLAELRNTVTALLAENRRLREEVRRLEARLGCEPDAPAGEDPR
jgi:hypothetical protein